MWFFVQLWRISRTKRAVNVSKSSKQSVLRYWRGHQMLPVWFLSTFKFLESKTTPIILSSLFPLIPRVFPRPYILRLSKWLKRGPMVYLLCVAEHEAWRTSSNEGVVSPHSGSFLPFPSGSHTFLVARGEPGLAWSGCCIPVVNVRPLNQRHLGDVPAFVTVLNRRLCAPPFSQLVIRALLV